VTRCRVALENRQLAAGTINGRLAAVRRLAYKALKSPDLSFLIGSGSVTRLVFYGSNFRNVRQKARVDHFSPTTARGMTRGGATAVV